MQGLQSAKLILRGLEDSKLAGRSYSTSAIGAALCNALLLWNTSRMGSSRTRMLYLII